MISASIDFLLRTNADYGEEISFTDGTEAIDLSGLTFSMQVRSYPGGPLLFVVPVTVTNAANGEVSITVARDTIKNAYSMVTGRDYGDPIIASHDIMVKHVDDFIEPWAEGRVTIQPGVTENG